MEVGGGEPNRALGLLLFWTDLRINIIPVRNLRVRQFGPIRSIRSGGDPHLTTIVDLTTIVL